ncbi:MAG: SCO family protein [Solirubrobacteraceae bacterium]
MLRQGCSFSSARARPWRRACGIAAALLLGGALTACGSSSRSASSAGSSGARQAGAPANTGLEGGLILDPSQPEARLALHNYTGEPVSLAALKGKAVFVTFVYVHCPNVCPLIVSNLAAAQRTLGAQVRDVRFIAVTVDPKGDTPAAVKTFLTARGALGMDYLIGSRAELQPVWKAWHVTVTLNSQTLTHSDVVYGISASGKLAIVLPSDFNPGQIVHDAALLQHS